MALFFDLSIPYLEEGGETAAHPSPAEARARKDARLKAVVRAMELGYVGVAYDRRFRAGAVLSDAERCKIAPFPLSSLLEAAPRLAASAALHRELLGAPPSMPFRQYSRLTVAAAGASAVLALNGNPVVRTYDLVAVRPLSQEAFDKACECSQVDLIAVDFSQKLPFRFKHSMVKLAIKRGLHFEITYSHLIADVHLRRQILSDAKLLVDWTRGKNLIVSSAASSVNDLRGPHDIVNLASFLLGLSIERAKSAMSRNCRSLIAKALRKKHFYKEAIKIERVTPDDQLGSENSWFINSKIWDPITSGDGDLPSLDDIANMFSSATKPAASSNSMDFTEACKTTFLLSQGVTMTSSSKTEGTFADTGEVPSSAHDNSTNQVAFNNNEVTCEENSPVQSLQQEKVPSEEVLILSSEVETQSLFVPSVAIPLSSQTNKPCADECENQSSDLINGNLHAAQDNQVVDENDIGLQPLYVLTKDVLVAPPSGNLPVEGAGTIDNSDDIGPFGANPAPLVNLSNFLPPVSAEDMKQSNNITTEPLEDVAEAMEFGPCVSGDNILMDRNIEQAMPKEQSRMTAMNLCPEDAYQDLDKIALKQFRINNPEKGETPSKDVILIGVRQDIKETAEGDFLNFENYLSLNEDKVTVKGAVPMLSVDKEDTAYESNLGIGVCRDRLLRPAYPLPFRNLFRHHISSKRLLQRKRKRKTL